MVALRGRFGLYLNGAFVRMSKFFEFWSAISPNRSGRGIIASISSIVRSNNMVIHHWSPFFVVHGSREGEEKEVKVNLLVQAVCVG